MTRRMRASSCPTNGSARAAQRRTRSNLIFGVTLPSLTTMRLMPIETIVARVSWRFRASRRRVAATMWRRSGSSFASRARLAGAAGHSDRRLTPSQLCLRRCRAAEEIRELLGQRFASGLVTDGVSHECVDARRHVRHQRGVGLHLLDRGVDNGVEDAVDQFSDKGREVHRVHQRVQCRGAALKGLAEVDRQHAGGLTGLCPQERCAELARDQPAGSAMYVATRTVSCAIRFRWSGGKARKPGEDSRRPRTVRRTIGSAAIGRLLGEVVHLHQRSL